MLILPLLGNASRFKNQGITVPKYLLCIAGKPVLHWVLKSFEKITEDIIILYRSDQVTDTQILKVCDEFCNHNIELIPHDKVTSGQAESVYLATNSLQNQSVLTFNGDSFFDKPLSTTDVLENANFVSTFTAEGNQWSFVQASEDDILLDIKEKYRISDDCSNGLYGFASSANYNHYFEMTKMNNLFDNEIFVSDVIKTMIVHEETFYKVHCKQTYVNCGTPVELTESRKTFHAY